MSVSITRNTRPHFSQRRQSSRMAGGFEPGSDIRDDVSHAGDEDEESHNYTPLGADDADDAPFPDYDSSSLLPPRLDDPSSLLNGDSQPIHKPARAEDLGHSAGSLAGLGITDNTVLEEQEMNKKLGEFESSFLPEHSKISSVSEGGHTRQHDGSHLSDADWSLRPTNQPYVEDFTTDEDEDLPHTPPAVYKTPMPEQQEARASNRTPDIPNTSALEKMSSSPTAARTVSRVQSLATLGGYETADEAGYPDSPTARRRSSFDMDLTPRKGDLSSASGASGTVRVNLIDTDGGSNPDIARKRPQYLRSRSSNARLSYDSIASSTTDASEATLGADFALQSGGAAPEFHPRLQRKGKISLSRQTSFGSLASGVSTMSDDESQPGKRAAIGNVPDLSTLHEESPPGLGADVESPTNVLATPRASIANFAMPTDTVIAKHVRDLEVPGTVVRQFKADQKPNSEMGFSSATMTPGSKRGLTLKEHRSTVEKLGKENFDLKMKIHFLDQALQRRSEDGVKEMITENVQLKSDRMRLEKDIHNLKKQVRELQKKLDQATGAKDAEDQGYATDGDRSPTIEEEVLYLRQRVEISEVELEKLRHESFAKEMEKRRLAEMLRNLGDHKVAASDVGSREERDMWKDMLEAETIAREQSEEDNKKLREEIAKLRQETFGTGGRSRNLRIIGGSVASRSSSVEGSHVTKIDGAEVERLRHEISELQKTIGAQASALTSRNREKERLYQEIEDLKLGRMGGLRSVAGDSIFERSASRARSNSRASNGTRYTRISETEREVLEVRINELRDEVSQSRLNNQNLQSRFDEALTELDAVDAQAQADADQFNEEMILLTQERDNALRDADEQERAFQQLKNEAQEEIDGLGDELDAKVDECVRLEQDLQAQAENVQALQSEMRSASEGLIRLEQDAQSNLSRYQSVKADLDHANRELENIENTLREANSKVQRLTVQQESSHNEIAFLREEQDGDKIKIGDMESLLKKVHLNLDAERDRARDLERRLVEERQQREAVTSQEKQEVQRVINELNREITSTKDELRRVRKTLSSRDIENSTHKDRLEELENSLRNIINDPTATRTTLISTTAKVHRDLEQTTAHLDTTRSRLDEHAKLLADRNTLLETSALESRRLTELLERERQARRQDKNSFEQSLKGHQQAARAAGANNARMHELEQARQTHRKQLAQVEGQYKDQLAERNQVLLTIWKKLTSMCGPDWTHNHSLVSGNLPSQEVIGNMLFWPSFSRNMLLAVRQVDGVLSSYREKIKQVERNLWKEYNNVERELDLRTKKLERIEESWEKIKLKEREIDAANTKRSSRYASHSANHDRSPSTGKVLEAQKLKGENCMLKAELQLLHQQQSQAQYRVSQSQLLHGDELRPSSFSTNIASNDGAPSAANGGIPVRGSSMRRRTADRSPLSRHKSKSVTDTLPSLDGQSERSGSVTSGSNNNHGFTISNNADEPNQLQGRGLMVPAGPLNAPVDGNFAAPPLTSSISNPNKPPTITNASDAGTITTEHSLKNLNDEGKWIHRLRELERRLKAEREQRLVDRSGMRRRLEERDAVNEELRRELEREKLIRASWGSPQVGNANSGTFDNSDNYESGKGVNTGHDADGDPTAAEIAEARMRTVRELEGDSPSKQNRSQSQRSNVSRNRIQDR